MPSSRGPVTRVAAPRHLPTDSPNDPPNEVPRHELCPVQAACGGCPLLPLGDAVRAEQCCDALQRALGGAGLEPPEPRWHAAPEPLRYRNRLRLAVGDGGEPRFFNAAKAADCAVVSESVLDGIEVLRAAARAVPAGLMAFSHLELRGKDALGRWGLRCAPREPGVREHPVLSALGAEWLVGVAPGSVPSVVPTMPCQRFDVTDGCYLEVPLDAFLQVNSAVNRMLVSHVVSGLRERGARSFADLYMGAGNFALPLLDAGLLGWGAERHVGAVVAARRAASEQGLLGAAQACEHFSAGDALTAADAWAQRGVRLDAVVLDPPRAGLGVRAPIATGLGARWLVLCSCHTEGLAADVSRLVAEGFAIQAVEAFDMFPQTRHVESVVWLERRRSGPVGGLPRVPDAATR